MRPYQDQTSSGVMRRPGQPALGDGVTTRLEGGSRPTTLAEVWAAPYVRAVVGPIDTQFGYRRELSRIPTALEPAFRGIVAGHAALRRPEGRVVFFGGADADTSGLINRLLGTRLLPTGPQRLAGVVTTVRHGETLGATLSRRLPDGTLVQVPAPPSTVGRTIVLDVHDPGAPSPDDPDGVVEEMTYSLPHPMLKAGAVLVDTPGLLDDPALTALTLRELERADLAVMVLRPPQLLSENECAAISMVHRLLHGNIVFVVNRFDEVPHRERAEVLAWARNGLARCGNSLVGRPRLFVTGAAESFDRDDPGTLELERWLATVLQRHQMVPLCLRARLGVLRSRVATFRAQSEAVLDEARQQIEGVEHVDANERVVQQRAVHHQVSEAREHLAKLRGHLGRRGHRLVNECVRDVDRALASQATSTEQLTACLTSAVEAYIKDVERSAKDATKYLTLSIPPCAGAIPATGQISLAGDPLGNALAVVGGLLGLIVLGVTGIFGVAVGKWLGGILGGDRHARTREQARAIAQGVVPALQAAADDYLARIDAAVCAYERINQPPEAPSPALRSARARVRAQEQVTTWAHGLGRAIAEAEGVLGA